MAFKRTPPAVLSIFSVLFTLAVLEAGIRMFAPVEVLKPRRIEFEGKSQEWCCLGEIVEKGGLRVFKPGARFKHCYQDNKRGHFDEENCVSYEINEWGYRDSPYEIEKKEGAYRIVVIGDSFTVGEGVSVSRVYTRLLHDALKGSKIVGKTPEIVNLGFSGSNTHEELLRFRKFGRLLKPDLVILQWNTNDFPSSKIAAEHERLIGSEYAETFEDLRKYSFSHLLYFTLKRIRFHRISKRIVGLTHNEVRDGELQYRRFREFHALAKEEGVEMVVLLFPELIQLQDHPYQNIIEAVEKFCKDSGIPVINALPALAEHEDRDLWVHETDHHPNEIAHRIVARLLRDYLKKIS